MRVIVTVTPRMLSTVIIKIHTTSDINVFIHIKFAISIAIYSHVCVEGNSAVSVAKLLLVMVVLVPESCWTVDDCTIVLVVRL